MVSKFVNNESFMRYVWLRSTLGIVLPIILIVVFVAFLNTGVVKSPVVVNAIAYLVVFGIVFLNAAWLDSFLAHRRFYRLLERHAPINGDTFVHEDETMYLTVQRAISDNDMFVIGLLVADKEDTCYSIVVERNDVRSSVELPPELFPIIQDGILVSDRLQEKRASMPRAQQAHLVKGIALRLKSVE